MCRCLREIDFKRAGMCGRQLGVSVVIGRDQGGGRLIVLGEINKPCPFGDFLAAPLLCAIGGGAKMFIINHTLVY